MDYTVFDVLGRKGIVPGMSVLPVKGHDHNRIYLVIKVEGPFAWLADGRVRSISSMKKKRVSHIKPLGQATDLVTADSLMAKNKSEADLMIREILTSFLEKS